MRKALDDHGDLFDLPRVLNFHDVHHIEAAESGLTILCCDEDMLELLSES